MPISSKIPLQASDPGFRYVAVTPGTTDLSLTDGPFRALWIGVTGNVNIVGMDDVSCVIPNVPVGVLPLGGKKVLATSTTATSIIAIR